MKEQFIAKDKFQVAYFSMEIALEEDLKTYAGGLGILAGDLLLSAAQTKFPMVGLTLINRQGYFKQILKNDGTQIAEPDATYNFNHLKKLDLEINVKIKSENIKVGVWQYLIDGGNGFYIPVYLLDTDLETNNYEARILTNNLYGGDSKYRLAQEIILGRGGVKILKALGYHKLKKYHLNEGHGAFAAIELFLTNSSQKIENKIKSVQDKIVFTTHTPLKKEQDVFKLEDLKKYQIDFPDKLPGLVEKNLVNTTKLALYFSGYNNGVSNLHGRVSQKMFPKYKIDWITNGVNSVNWSAPEFSKLYDHYLSGWRLDSSLLKKANTIPLSEIKSAHQQAKHRLVDFINEATDFVFSENIFTLVFARRFTPYKRPEFLFSDLTELLRINKELGPIQIIYAGKAHPRDLKGQKLIKNIYAIQEQLQSKIKMVFLEDYDIALSKLLVAGADLWLNTPLPPNEASGTSGMKAAHNGVPQLSTPDGWWAEIKTDLKVGWTIQEKIDSFGRKTSNIYQLLENILLIYYKQPDNWLNIQRNVISQNASWFNTNRALKEYRAKAYHL